MVFEIGSLCTKNAGRDQGLYCVIVDLDNNNALIDGQTRRRTVHTKHLTPTGETLPIKKGADHKTVVEEFSKKHIEVKETQPKEEKKKQARPVKKRTQQTTRKK